MGVLKELVKENKIRKVVEKATDKASVVEKNNAGALKTRMIESAHVALDTNYAKYGNLKKLLESNNYRDLDRAANTVAVLKNQENYLNNIKNSVMEQTVTAGFQNLTPKLLDIVSVFYPETIQHWVTDSQIADAQIAGVFVLKPIFEDTADGVVAGDEIFRKRTIHNSYGSERRYKEIAITSGAGSITFPEVPLRSGTVKVLLANSTEGTETVVGQDDGAGVITGNAGLAGTVNYETGKVDITAGGTANMTIVANLDTEINIDSNRKIILKIDNTPLKAEPHIIEADYSVESALAASAHLNVSVPEQVANIMGGALKSEKDNRIIGLINNNTINDADLKFITTVPSGVTKTAHFADFNLNVELAKSKIQLEMGRGDVDFIIAGINVHNVATSIPSFVADTTNKVHIGSYFSGYLDNGNVALIKSFTIPANSYIVGYKGMTTGDSAMIVMDWIQFYSTPELQKPNLRNSSGVASFYALHVNNKGYWKKSTIAAS